MALSRRLSLRRADISLNNFNCVAVPHLVGVLHTHRDNIRRFQATGEFDRIKNEQINATRTVIQLKHLLEEMDLLRQQIIEGDLNRFDQMTEKSRNLTNQAIKEYMSITHCNDNTISSSLSSGYSSNSPTTFNEANDPNQTYSQNVNEDINLQIDEMQLTQEQIQQQEDCLKSWEVLQGEVQELHELFVKFEEVIHVQAEPVNIVEENVETASLNVKSGVSLLERAERFKTAWYPIAGAVIGGCVAGPIGLVTGLKIGGLALISGTALGFTSGKFLKKKKESNSALSTNVTELSDKKNI
ncbi:syntaxin 17 [Arctopsyche grandis]|uniref:syntaxin 17 n=1 Tax=Arctopsyche grandis TaxID=121162 RepID=UPI00406D9619